MRSKELHDTLEENRRDLERERPPSLSSYYDAGGYSLRKVLEAFGLTHYAYRFAAAQYIIRAHRKHTNSPTDEIDDLRKAHQLLGWEIERLQDPIDKTST